MLELKNLSYCVRNEDGTDLTILNNISLTIEDNKLVVFTGPNGGGKTTLARAIMGLIRPTSGQIFYNGRDITDLGITERARLGICYGFQQPPRFKGMRVRDLLCIAAGNEKLPQSVCCDYLTQVGLCANDYLEREVDTSLSGGEVKRIEIATVLARKGSMLLFENRKPALICGVLPPDRNIQRTAQQARSHYDYHFPSGTHHRPGRRNRCNRRRLHPPSRRPGNHPPPDPVQHNGRLRPRKGVLHQMSELDKQIDALDAVDAQLLEKIADLVGKPVGALNIRKNGGCAARTSTEHIKIDPRTDGHAGIDIHILPGTKGETCHIPVVMTKTDLTDAVYNDFYVGEDCDVTIVAGCGIHNNGCGKTQHDGIHTFHIGKNSRVHYIEKHYGEGDGNGQNVMNPQTVVYLAEGASMQMDTAQIGGIDSTKRYTRFECADRAEAVVMERLLTHGSQSAHSDMDIVLNGKDAKGRVTSRSVAKGASRQVFHPNLVGNSACFGHVQCDSIIMDEAHVESIPALTANNTDAQLIHEAAIGKIAGDQLIKLMTLGLTEEEAEERILKGFLA